MTNSSLETPVETNAMARRTGSFKDPYWSVSLLTVQTDQYIENFNCNCSLHPGDLYPFLRKPLFLIVDSDNSSVFLVRVRRY